MTKVLLGIGFDVLFSELYKIMVNKVTFLDFRVGDRSPPSVNPPLFRRSIGSKKCAFLAAMLLFHTCFFQACSQLGTPRRRKSFLGRANFGFFAVDVRVGLI